MIAFGLKDMIKINILLISSFVLLDVHDLANTDIELWELALLRGGRGLGLLLLLRLLLLLSLGTGGNVCLLLLLLNLGRVGGKKTSKKLYGWRTIHPSNSRPAKNNLKARNIAISHIQQYQAWRGESQPCHRHPSFQGGAECGWTNEPFGRRKHAQSQWNEPVISGSRLPAREFQNWNYSWHEKVQTDHDGVDSSKDDSVSDSNDIAGEEHGSQSGGVDLTKASPESVVLSIH